MRITFWRICAANIAAIYPSSFASQKNVKWTIVDMFLRNMSKVKVLLAHHSLKPKIDVLPSLSIHTIHNTPIYDTILIYC